jgi:outer membrane protein assembly factor BamE (lipoprotein component of BamABCDE complex)
MRRRAVNARPSGEPAEMIRTALLLALVCLLGLAACEPTKVVRGHHVDPEDVARIQPDVTTQQQVAGILGNPSSVATFRQNTDTWYYITQRSERYTELDETTVAREVLAIDFDPQGRVSNVRQYTLDDSRDVAFVNRETPTQGAKLGLLEQLFGNILGGATP